MQRLLLLLPLAMACAAEEEPDDDDTPTRPQGACGAVTEHDVRVLGRVEDAGGNAVENADVRLEDKAWNPGTVLGTAVSSPDGSFAFTAIDVTSVEGCWGIALDYVLVAIRGTETGDKGINSQLFTAIDSGDFEADISAFPIVIQ